MTQNRCLIKRSNQFRHVYITNLPQTEKIILEWQRHILRHSTTTFFGGFRCIEPPNRHFLAETIKPPNEYLTRTEVQHKVITTGRNLPRVRFLLFKNPTWKLSSGNRDRTCRILPRKNLVLIRMFSSVSI